jgi:hypothetical protein
MRVTAYPWDGSRKAAYDERAPSSNETSCWSNSNKSSDDTLNSTDHSRTFEVKIIENDPNKHADCGAKIGVQNGSTGIGAGSIRVTTIETVPANPQNTGSNHHHD